MSCFTELEQFLQNESRDDLVILATNELLGLTGNEDGCEILVKEKQILFVLIKNLDHSNASVGKDTSLTLINISASENGSKTLVDLEATHQINIINKLLTIITDENNSLADPACMILANISRFSSLIPKLTELLDKCQFSFDKLITIFSNINFNKKGCNLHYLGPFFSNLSQIALFRSLILDKDKCVIQRLLPFTEYTDSHVRRGGVVATLKNCCFDFNYHEWLLSKEVDILPRLLLPLAGGEEFDDEDMDKLPIELQYLPSDKQRETDNDIRIMLFEALEQLCATRKGREILRNNNTYIILREYHKWEKDRKVLLACENVIDILIRTEEEIGEDNLKKLEVPEEYVEKFIKMDEEFVKDI